MATARIPDWVDPMLATLSHDVVEGARWAVEDKLDGERCLVFVRNGVVELYSRNKKELNQSYPELVAAVTGLRLDDCVLDGEIVALDGDGRSSFELLQPRFSSKGGGDDGLDISLVLFDVLFVNGKDVRVQIYDERRALLLGVIPESHDVVSVVVRHKGNVPAVYAKACERGDEGVIVKDVKSVYESGVRSRSWLKLKCELRQEFIVLGYTRLRGTGNSVGALLVGYYDGDDVRYAGKVGTGFDDATRVELFQKLSNMKRQRAHVDDDVEDGAQWVRASLVCEVGFTEWTSSGKLRHPRFLGVRRDKDPKDVRRES